ncbi:hypothetical protein MASR1M8_21600 [Thermomonas brevis]
MKAILAVLPVLLLAACNAPPAPAAADPAPAPAATPATDAAPAAPIGNFRAFGNEPFWNAEVAGDSLTFTTPEDQQGQTMSGSREAFEQGVEIRGSHGGQPFVLSVRAGECSDGMSDNTYAMTSQFDVGGQLLKGCAELKN